MANTLQQNSQEIILPTCVKFNAKRQNITKCNQYFKSKLLLCLSKPLKAWLPGWRGERGSDTVAWSRIGQCSLSPEVPILGPVQSREPCSKDTGVHVSTHGRSWIKEDPTNLVRHQHLSQTRAVRNECEFTRMIATTLHRVQWLRC